MTLELFQSHPLPCCFQKPYASFCASYARTSANISAASASTVSRSYGRKVYSSSMTDEAILEDHAQACRQDVTHQRATADGGVRQSLHSPRIHSRQRRRSVQVLAERLTHSGQ